MQELKLFTENITNYEVVKDYLTKGVISKCWKGNKSEKQKDGTYKKLAEEEIVMVIAGGYKEQFVRLSLDIFEKLFPNMIPELENMIGRKVLVSNSILVEN